MTELLGDRADAIRERQRLGKIGEFERPAKVVRVVVDPLRLQVMHQRPDLVVLQRLTVRRGIRSAAHVCREGLRMDEMPERFAAIDIDDRHVVGESPLEVRIFVDVDLDQLDGGLRGFDRGFSLVAERAIAARVERDLHEEKIHSVHMRKNVLDLTNRIVLITGASRGIGRETALQMAEAGALLGLNYHQSELAIRSLTAEIGDERCIAIRADIGDPAETEAMVDAVIHRFGRIDILVNNAAVFDLNRFEGDDYEAWRHGWRKTFDVNVFGAANAAYLAMRSMRANGGGKIINVASRAAFRGETEFADYGASKAALVNLTRSIARACAKDNIVASCVAPGFIETEMAHAELAAHRDEIVGQIPLRRVGTPADVAAAILFLASPQGDYLNGVTIDINGGSWFH